MKVPKPVRIPNAKNSIGNVINIEYAQSGRHGYTCTGCTKDLEAVISKLPNRQPYFRHVAKNMDHETAHCTFSNETYRHYLGKLYLQESKSIRVPRVLKFPPQEIYGDPRLISQAKTVTAARVLTEKICYLNSRGELSISDSGSTNDVKSFQVKPDVIFLDEHNKPILFIELVATNDINEEKLSKLRVLGVDTVSVNLPIDSQESIRDCFNTSERTRWIYNHEREHADYTKLPSTFGFRVKRSNDYERGFRSESTLCRANRVRELIRGIKNYLGSDAYREHESAIAETQRDLESKIGVAEGAITQRREYHARLDAKASEIFSRQRIDVQNRQERLDSIRERLEARYQAIRASIFIRTTRGHIQRRRDIEKEEDRIYDLTGRIKERYERKGTELEHEESQLSQTYQSVRTGSENIRAEKDNEQRSLDRAIEQKRSDIERIQRDISSLQSKMGSIQEDFESERNRIEERFRNEESQWEGVHGKAVQRITNQIREFEQEQIKLPDQFEKDRADLERRKHQDRERIISATKTRDTSRDTELPSRFKPIVYAGRELRDYLQAARDNKRVIQQLKYFSSEAFKVQINSRQPQSNDVRN